MGWSMINSRMTKPTSRTAAMMASVTMKFDPNQSSSWPLSSMICSAPMPTASMPNPQKSARSEPRRM